ncbi:MAG: hypothetical protein GY720_11435 [bacterium]|nr:hypothetical protein [bacterium]
MTHVERTVFTVATADGDIELEARWDLCPEPERVAVLCHPHPQQRGTMNAPLMQSLTDSLVEHQFAVMRFNFRGVGHSSGTHDFGQGEMDDVAAAVATAHGTYSELPIGVAGWSFGAATSLRWQARDGNRLPWVGVAPPVNSSRSLPLPSRKELAAAPRTIILGDRDQFATVEDSRAYADAIGADLQVLKGSDHFFYFREEKIAALVADGLSEPA